MSYQSYRNQLELTFALGGSNIMIKTSFVNPEPDETRSFYGRAVQELLFTRLTLMPDMRGKLTCV